MAVATRATKHENGVVPAGQQTPDAVFSDLYRGFLRVSYK
jgi:hypothetical protein